MPSSPMNNSAAAEISAARNASGSAVWPANRATLEKVGAVITNAGMAKIAARHKQPGGVYRQARALASIGSLNQRCECHRSASFLSDRRLGGQTRQLIVDIEL